MIDIPKNVEGFVFDCDGTLIDSMPLHKQLWSLVLQPYGVELPSDYIDTHAGKPTDVIVEIINKEFNVSIVAEELLEDKERQFRARIDEAGPIDSIIETARKYLGKIPMSVVSGGCKANVQLSLEVLGIADWFPIVLTADDPITPKPAPDLFLKAAELMKVPATACHAFEDADAGIASAKAAGMTVTDVREVLASLG